MTDTPAEVAEAMASLEKAADAHEYFARNGDLRMTTGDHAWEAKRIRAAIADLQSQLAAQRERDGRAIEIVRDRILLAAIGPNWRERMNPSTLDFWTSEVREALDDAACSDFRAGRTALHRQSFTLASSDPVAGPLSAIERELRDMGSGDKPMTWDYALDRMNALADAIDAALKDRP